MLILIPWKPVVVVWGLLSAVILFGYIAGSLMKGQNPFAYTARQRNTLSASHTAVRSPERKLRASRSAKSYRF